MEEGEQGDIPKRRRVYEHFSGQRYKVIGLASRITEGEAILVLRKIEKEKKVGSLHYLPVYQFFERVDEGSGEEWIPRFRELKTEELRK